MQVPATSDKLVLVAISTGGPITVEPYHPSELSDIHTNKLFEEKKDLISGSLFKFVAAKKAFEVLNEKRANYSELQANCRPK